MRKRSKDKSIIYCGTPQDADLAYIAMFRYAFGRMTYMPEVVIGIIKRNAERLTDRCLAQLERELTEEAECYERAWKDKPNTNYGWECDRQMWLAFHQWVRDEIIKREESK